MQATGRVQMRTYRMRARWASPWSRAKTPPSVQQRSRGSDLVSDCHTSPRFRHIGLQYILTILLSYLLIPARRRKPSGKPTRLYVLHTEQIVVMQKQIAEERSRPPSGSPSPPEFTVSLFPFNDLVATPESDISTGVTTTTNEERGNHMTPYLQTQL